MNEQSRMQPSGLLCVCVWAEICAGLNSKSDNKYNQMENNGHGESEQILFRTGSKRGGGGDGAVMVQMPCVRIQMNDSQHEQSFSQLNADMFYFNFSDCFFFLLRLDFK